MRGKILIPRHIIPELGMALNRKVFLGFVGTVQVIDFGKLTITVLPRL